MQRPALEVVTVTGRRDRHPCAARPRKGGLRPRARRRSRLRSVSVPRGRVGSVCARAAAHEAITPKHLVPDPAAATVVDASPRAVYRTRRTSLLVEGPLRSQRRALRHYECKLG